MDFPLLIGGRPVDGAARLEVINPATGQVFASCARADAAQLNAAVAAAKAVFPEWSRTPSGERRSRLLAIAEALDAKSDEIARTLTAEQGKPLVDAKEEVAGSAYIIRTAASFAANEVTVIKDDAGGSISEHRTPLGVVAAITPWNFPVMIAACKTAYALMAGNTVVFKPAPTTPLSGLMFADICNAQLPPGVINAIVDQNDLGAMLTSHPDVAKVTFTGSTATGKRVVEAGASTLKRITLELGGNDAAIVLGDVDPKAVAAKLFNGAMINAGQACVAIKRVYAPEAMYDEICDALAKLADAAVVGDGMRPESQIGPLQNKTQYQKVLSYIERAGRDGRIIAGGAHEGPGYFIRPTIVRDIGDDTPLVREEQFGPVLPVLKYKDVGDAIRRANDSTYGLAGTVWSADVKAGVEVARQINTGTVWVNRHLASDLSVAMGGAKQSGLGVENGLEGLLEFTQRHVVYGYPQD
jgi:acyl-CoA reductase-like NAD-dependent aldehyde dehydrogenase